MSLTINLGTTSDDIRVLDKNYSLGDSRTCDVYENCTVFAPRLLINYSGSLASYNYMQIPAWNRFYYIKGIDLLPGSRAIIRGRIDALQSYKNQIKNLTVNVERQENLVEPYLPDNSYTFLDTYDVVAKLPSSRTNNSFLQDSTANSDYFVLGIMGGANSHIEDIAGFDRIQTEPSDWGTSYMNYFINVGTIANPQLKIIHLAYEDGNLDPNAGTGFNYVAGLYTVYKKA